MDRSYLVRTEDTASASPQLWFYIGLVAVLVYIVTALLMSCLFRKSGQKAWRAWVPFVNYWSFFKLGGLWGVNALWLAGAVLVLGLGLLTTNLEMSGVLQTIALSLTIVFYLAYIYASLEIQAKFGKPWWFIFTLFVNLVAPLWLWILALDNSKLPSKKSSQKPPAKHQKAKTVK
jgi:hypothetical protein